MEDLGPSRGHGEDWVELETGAGYPAGKRGSSVRATGGSGGSDCHNVRLEG